MIRVIIADDHAIVRRGLKEILSGVPDIAVRGEAGTVPELMEQLRSQEFDVVVLDVTMPGGSGFDALQELKRERRRLPVLMLSIYPEDQFGVRALRAGAAGYMTKESVPDALVGAIRKVYQGGRYVSPALAERLAYELDVDLERAPHERLSNREFEVLRLLATGKSPRQIAAEMSLSVKTVGTYRARLLEKMSMTSNAQLIRYATKQGLVQ
jgi:DNA-binding NarL/FixJ family response regulator